MVDNNGMVQDEETVMPTREQFEDYERVRASGATNMFDVRMVIALSDGLDKVTVMSIMKNYGRLMDLYPEVRG